MRDLQSLGIALGPLITMTIATAPAKLILCGEHAVVYGRPAIALPLANICAQVSVFERRAGSGIILYAHDLRRHWNIATEPNNPLSELITTLLAHLTANFHTRAPDIRISISSAIPIASGLGSGAAVATALIRALARHLGESLTPEAISALVYASEQRYHGTPSGIDNTVIAYEQPIWFVRTADPAAPIITPTSIASPFNLLIADTGVRSATRLPVSEVRKRWQAETARYEDLFDQIAALVTKARTLLAQGDIVALGPILSQNHALLQQIGVSSPELDTLVAAAHSAGALGAKLSGAGWGGVILALVTPATAPQVRQMLEQAGAKRVIETVVQQHLL